jgi:hypothetical protein
MTAVSGATATGVSRTNNPRIRELDVDNLGAGANINPDAFGLAAIDLANNYFFGSNSFTASGGNGIAGVRAAGVGFVLTSSAATICAGTTSGSCPASTTLTAKLETDPTVNSNPIQTIYFYFRAAGDDRTRDTGDDVWQLISSQNTSAVVPETGVNNRVYSATTTLTAATLPVTGATTLMAIGVDADGDAIAAFSTVSRTN